jgi:hypothetical protein
MEGDWRSSYVNHHNGPLAGISLAPSVSGHDVRAQPFRENSTQEFAFKAESN